MSHLHERAVHFPSVIRNLQSHEIATKALYNEVNTMCLHQPRRQPRSPSKLLISSLDKSVKLAPARDTLPLSPNSRKSDGTSEAMLSTSSRQLLGLLGISLSVDSNSEQIRNIFEAAVVDGEQKTSRHLSNQDLVIARSLIPHLLEAQGTHQLLTEVLYADSPYHRFAFVDMGVEKRTIGLESTIGDIGKRMAGLDMDVLQRGNRTRGEFVNRWAM